ncbi:MAG TPA: hypothetical protein VLC09_13335, partial [Polyangiaceae bacterium]|nr:hypothetical protein [Polyangiaceae bacterium]
MTESVPPSNGARAGQPGAWHLLLALAVCLLFAAGCGTDGDTRPGMLSDEGIGGESNGSDGYGYGQPCDAGADRACSVTIEQASGVTSCWKGTQYCEDGKWGVCHTEQDESAETADASLQLPGAKSAALVLPGAKSAALTTVPALPCSSNKCDPSCRHYTETPNLTTSGGGADPPDPPDFTTPGKTVCAHNLCDAGAKLDS